MWYKINEFNSYTFYHKFGQIFLNNILLDIIINRKKILKINKKNCLSLKNTNVIYYYIIYIRIILLYNRKTYD